MRNKYVLLPYDLYEQAKHKYDDLLNSDHAQENSISTDKQDNNINTNIAQTALSNNNPQSNDTAVSDPTPGIERLPSKDGATGTTDIEVKPSLGVDSATSKFTTEQAEITPIKKKKSTKTKTRKRDTKKETQISSNTAENNGRWIFL